MTREEQTRAYVLGAYSLGWLDGFSTILWALVGDKLSDEIAAEYGEHIGRLREAMNIEGRSDGQGEHHHDRWG